VWKLVPRNKTEMRRKITESVGRLRKKKIHETARPIARIRMSSHREGERK
jgi:hypothetical protein